MQRPSRLSRFTLCALLCAIGSLLAACDARGDAAPVVKIGVIAPFEGVGRPLGYAVLPAVKQAVAEANARGDFGRYRVAVAAFNDDLYGPTAAAQAQALARDPAVAAVLGPWSAGPAAAAAPVLAEAGLPYLARPDQVAPAAGEKWDAATLNAAAAQADADARRLLAALAAVAQRGQAPTRVLVAAALR